MVLFVPEGVQQLPLHQPELLRKVHVVIVGVLEPLHFVPQQLHLGCAVAADLCQAGLLVHQLAVLEYGLQQLLGDEIRQLLGLPDRQGIENGQGLGIVDLLVPDADLIRQGLPRLPVKEAVDLLEVGVCDLCGVLADLDLGDDGNNF